MKALFDNSRRVLGIDPTPRGFGFAVLEGPSTLIDWGVKAVRTNKRSGTLSRISDLMRQYRPDIVIIEDCSAKGARRCPRVQRLIGEIGTLATSAGVRTRAFSQRQVKQFFTVHGASTKHQIAQIIGMLFPELAGVTPPYRKPWMSEDYRMAFFDAIALVLTYFQSRRHRSLSSADHLSEPNSNARS